MTTNISNFCLQWRIHKGMGWDTLKQKKRLREIGRRGEKKQNKQTNPETAQKA